MGHQSRFFLNLWVAYLRIMLTASLRSAAPLQDNSSNGCVSDLSDLANVCSRLKSVPLRSVACTSNSEAHDLIWDTVKAGNKWRIVFSSPISSREFENHTTVCSAEYQYMRELMSWSREHGRDHWLTVDYMPRDRLDQDGPLLTHRGAHTKTALVLVGMWDQWEKFRGIFEQLERDNVTVLWVHDSACWGKGEWIRVGCPSPNSRNTLFTPWGSSPDLLYRDKTKTPSMFVDGTRPWGVGSGGGPSLEDFLRRVRAENMGINVTCLQGCERIPDLVDTCISEELPRSVFFSLLRGTWFFATGYRGGYELGKSDAQMAGAILLETSSRDDKHLSMWQRDDGHSLAETNLTDLVSGIRALVENQPAFALAADEVRQHAIDFHAPDYMWSNLLCALHSPVN